MPFKIILSGGGTGGSITPLLAIAEELQSTRDDVEFLWIGTKKGIEEKMVENAVEKNGLNIKFKAICSGKLRRYFSWRNFIDPIFIKIGFFQSLYIIYRFKPDIIITAGGFMAVPVVWAGWILRVPVLVHQQDVEVGLANKLMMPFARIITYNLENTSSKDALDLPTPASCLCPACADRMQCADRQTGRVSTTRKKKIYFTGNAVRRKILEVVEGRCDSPKIRGTKIEAVAPQMKVQNKICIKGTIAHPLSGTIKPSSGEINIPSLLVLGGGTGALAVNTIIVQSLSELTKICNVVHVTGGKLPPLGGDGRGGVFNKTRYHSYPFLNNIEKSLVDADIVISRCGMSFLSELAVLGKPSILIPMPNTHQEANAKYFTDRNSAIVLNQKELTPEILVLTIKNLLSDKNKMRELSDNIFKIMPRDGAKRIAEIVIGEYRNEH